MVTEWPSRSAIARVEGRSQEETSTVNVAKLAETAGVTEVPCETDDRMVLEMSLVVYRGTEA